MKNQLKDFIERVKATSALFYGIDLDEEATYYLEKLTKIYAKHNKNIQLLGMVLFITPDDKIIHIYVEEDYVIAINTSFPDYSEFGYSIPLSELPKRFGIIIEAKQNSSLDN